VQTIASGAAVVTFSGDKLFGGPQAGIIVGRADLIERCRRHPLARALRPGGLVLDALQQTTLALIDRDLDRIPFWKMVATPTATLETRAKALVASIGAPSVSAVPTAALPGAGSAPGVTMPSFGLAIDGDHVAGLRAQPRPVIARAADGVTLVDLRAVDPDDDSTIVAAIRDVLGVVGAPER
jgi:L-seryl-tRNA(Ser) seleniumtransferase